MKNKIGVHVPAILMPKDGISMSKWSVVACDQYTSQPEYWDEVEKIAGGEPSTLYLTLPEVYLESEDKDERIARINQTMLEYLENDILLPQNPGIIYVDRKTSHAPSRKGLVLAVDLEEYDYKKGAQTLIRATEGTVIDRLPPRIKIRENAAIELPHIMLLIDDEHKTVIEPISHRINALEKLYDFELMMEGGHIKGYKIEDKEILDTIIKNLEELSSPENFKRKYGVDEQKGVLLFAVGDGNHSLASAKAFWEKFKASLPEADKEEHPARYALVEVVNVHDEGLQFEPIHRVLFDVDVKMLLNKMLDYYNASGCQASYSFLENRDCMEAEIRSMRKESPAHFMPFTSHEFCGYVSVNCPKYNLEVGTLQDFIDSFLTENKKSRVDYIHGADVVQSLGSQPGNMGFFLPAMDKRDLFKTVVLDGALPRKTFSMGEAEEKRFYLESRKIR